MNWRLTLALMLFGVSIGMAALVGVIVAGRVMDYFDGMRNLP